MNLSVIVANYNNAPYIKECLESIVTQTYKDFEIIVSDDGSTDESPHIIKEYEKKYPGIVKGIFCPFNRGVAQTRHEAMLQARGEYITTLDSDDYYNDPHKLEKEMELIHRHKEKDGKDILAFSNVLMVKEDKTLIHNMGDTETIKEGMLLENIISRSCMIPRDFIMVRAAYFEVGGYDLSLKTHEDWDLKIRLAARYPFYYTHHTGTGYRRHSSGLSGISHHIRTKNLWKVFFKNLPLIPLEKKKPLKNDFILFMIKRERGYMKTLARSHVPWEKLRTRFRLTKNKCRLHFLKFTF